MAYEFLDLAHRYILLTTSPENNAHDKLNNILIGPLRTMDNDDKVVLVDNRAGIVPPAWWRGDAEASQSSVAAMRQMTRRR